MVEDVDSQLVQKIRDVVNRVFEEQLSDGVNSVECLRVVGNTEHDSGIFQYEPREVPWAVHPIAGNISAVAAERYDEAEELSEYLKQEYDIDVHKRVLKTLFIRIFGRELEYLDRYNSRVDELGSEITADAENPTYDVKVFLFGFDTRGHDIGLPRGKIREPVEEDLSFHVNRISELIPNVSTLPADQKVLNSSVLEFSTTEWDDMESQREAHGISDLTCNILNIYHDASYSIVRRELEPRYFRPSGNTTTHPETRIAPQARFEVENHDGEKLGKIYGLMNEKWSLDDHGNGSFEYPFDIAVNNLYRAWEQRNRRRESMGWMVIAFEALFGSGKGKVSTYCSILLDSADSVFNPLDVRSHIQDAFDERHSWAHGGSRKNSEMSKSHARIRDYLRTTMIAYTYLLTEDHMNDYKQVVDTLEDAVVEESVRDQLENHFSNFRFQDYLRIENSLH